MPDKSAYRVLTRSLTARAPDTRHAANPLILMARPKGFEPLTPRFVVCHHSFPAVFHSKKLYDDTSKRAQYS
jgi:hypothetical protein